MSKHRFTKLLQLSTLRTTHCTIERGLCIGAPETRHEPSCVSNNPFHQRIGSGRSVLRAVLHCCRYCAHLSLHLFLVVVHCSVALMRSSGRASDDCLFWTFGFHMSDGSGSHCQMMSEGPRQFNMCTPTVSNCGCAVPTRFHMHLNTFSPSEAENILQNNVSYFTVGSVHCLRSYVHFVCVVLPVRCL